MLPSIFEYTNYRQYLKDCYGALKKNDKSFTYRTFAREAGVSSAGFLYLIMDGSRNLSKDIIPNFAEVLKFGKKEHRYFDALVSFNQARSQEAKRYYLELLVGLKGNKIGTLLSDTQFEYLSNWYYPVIREMVTLPEFIENGMWIRSRLQNRVTIKQANDAIDALLRLGMLKRGENGRLVQAEANIVTEDEVQNATAYTFHQQMLSVAKDALAKTASEKREVSSLTMAVSAKQFEEIKRRIREFEDQIANYMNNDPQVPETVCQLNMLLYPVMNPKKLDSGKTKGTGNGNGGGK